VAARFLHVSDLHFGAGIDSAIEAGLEALVERLRPDLIVASGDLTHRARRAQHERAARFLRSLGPPIVAVPGNHDIPLPLHRRFVRPFRDFERIWETTEPIFESDAIYVVGLNSARPWRHQSGGIRDTQLRRTRELFSRASDRSLRVVVLHHHLIGAPWRSRKKPVSHRNTVLAGLVDAGAELILAGHIHQAAISERHEFEVVTGEIRAVTVSVAPGLGQPRPDRRGEARGLHLYEAGDGDLRVETDVWREDDWGLTAIRRFPRGRRPLASEPASPR